jgi:hypothetical protein
MTVSHYQSESHWFSTTIRFLSDRSSNVIDNLTDSLAAFNDLGRSNTRVGDQQRYVIVFVRRVDFECDLNTREKFPRFTTYEKLPCLKYFP